MITHLWAIAMVIIATLIGGFGPILLKKATATLHRNIRSIITNLNLYLGIAMYGFGTILFIPALKGGDLSVLYPMVATGYIWVSLYSMKFLGEKMNAKKWLGIALIIAGVSLIGFGAG